MERLSDEQLVAHTLQGEQAAFNVLVERYQKQIYSLAYRLCNDYDEARDLAQEAFIRVYQQLPTFDQNRKFFSWMYRVAHNTCINILHKRPKESLNLDEYYERYEPEAEGISGDPSGILEDREQAEEFTRILQELPEQYRTVILLKYLEGLSYREISEHLDLPESTVEARLHRGRNYLRNMLQKQRINVG
ncbi:MAG: sigma-70 family RNA polymerase sigma factor [Clostridiales bacterium]|nr:sigma-70 family RNA polymerase sigma factor [Clostridiales bacterium]